MTTPPSPPNAASSLPAELMSLIYAPLSQHDLLAAAAVSSWWRTNAVDDRNYYCAWTVVFPNPAMLSRPRASRYADIGNLVSIIDDSETHGYHLGLSLFIDLADFARDPDSDDSVSTSSSEQVHSSSNAILDDLRMKHNKAVFTETVLPALLRAQPRIAVLNLYPCLHSLPLLRDCLSSPAPVLRKLEIRAGMYDSTEEPGAPPLPAHFLAGSAPRLEGVSLIMTSVSRSTPVFPSVRRLQIAYPFVSPGLDVVFSCFPNISELDIQCFPDDAVVSPADCALLEKLQILRFGPESVGELMGVLPVSTAVPVIEYRSTPVFQAVRLLSMRDPLTVRIFEHLRRVSDDGDEEPHDAMMDEARRFTQICM
ncbi:hypothetical protein AURDEDRAFT_163433 [Auricularia subglabra TFB-10046 SS5]|nr:hypothetical protein AURDEDRAFT_163433 [Auricularia subglabra TFB-10046 SS5]